MDYKSLMGYGKKKKKVVKEQQKPKKTILDSIKQELNEWSHKPPTVKRWSKSLGGNGLTEYEENKKNKDDKDVILGKQIKEVGGGTEYRKYYKNIEKAENKQAKEVNNFVKLLQKKGLKKEATFLAGAYMKSMREFEEYLKKLIGTLM